MGQDENKSIRYWRNRAAKREAELQAESGKVIAQVRKAYELAFKNIEEEIRKIERAAARVPEDELKPYAARKLRFENLKRAIDAEVNRLGVFETGVTKERYANAIEKAFYYKIFDIQQQTGVGFNFSHLPQKAIEETLKANWSGNNFSGRVWKNTHVVSKHANEIINAGLLSGESIPQMVEKLLPLVETVNLDKAKMAATRLIRTEVNYFMNQGELQSYKEAGIERYEYVAVLDLKTSEMCRDLDGEKIPVEDAEAGKNYPPMHPWCRSTTVAVIEDRTAEKLKRSARDPETGKSVTVPGDISYHEWYEKYALPKILTDDEKYAINQYISSESYKVNEKLRDGTKLTDAEQKLVDNLDAALRKLPKYAGIVSRSVALSGEKLEKFLTEHKKGDTIRYKAFTSFTNGDIYNDNARVQLYVESKSCRNMSIFNVGEGEMLYERGSRFTIVDVKILNGEYHIFLEEVR